MTGLLVGALELLIALHADSAQVGGTVRDGVSGLPIAGAVVTLTDLDRFALTDADGRYLLQGVPAGPQHLLVQRIGYAPRSLHALAPRDGYLEINISLRAQPIPLGALEVRPAVAVRDLEDQARTPFAERSMSIAAVRNHPLLSEPDAFQAFSSGEVVLRPESPNGVHVRGGSADQTAYVLDGIPVFNPYHAAGTFSAWNPDALAHVQLSTLGPADGVPAALSGMLHGFTRAPGAAYRVQGSLSTTQARLTVDGPVSERSGFLISARTGFNGIPALQNEASYLRAQNEDYIAKLELPLLGGRIHLLAYDNGNQIEAAAVPDVEAPAGEVPEHSFRWHSRSLGGEWTVRRGAADVLVRGWSAAGNAAARWNAQPIGRAMSWRRRDYGAVAMVSRSDASGTSVTGVRLERSSTSYELSDATGAPERFGLRAHTPTAALFGGRTQRIGAQAAINAGITATALSGELYLAPRAQMRVQVAPLLSLTGSYARLYQFAQSLRNDESMVGNIFPVDLFVGASSAAIPVARSDVLVVASEYRPLAGA
ncbi:MAG TPA: carboxypeptidase regulatory-like domain-containing protein, partial [Longimicrobiales bacterium]|nr:carboxypeptidase regulatory-like domain-containing protein [Longimicrobiales bacterium]